MLFHYDTDDMLEEHHSHWYQLVLVKLVGFYVVTISLILAEPEPMMTLSEDILYFPHFAATPPNKDSYKLQFL